MVEIVRGPIDSYVLTNMLEEYFSNKPEIQGTLYFGYPIVSDYDDTYKVDAMLVSKDYGVVLFDFKDCYEFDEDELVDSQYSVINSFTSKLLKNKKLMKKRQLLVDVNMITLIPKLSSSFNIDEDQDYFVAKDNESMNKILESILNPIEQPVYESLMQSIQAITTIKHRSSKRTFKTETSRAAKLDKLEKEISNLDIIQTRAVIETSKGPQRIRGLAGSGKTIVLALKVAYLHVYNPEWKIAVTFNTRSLKDQFYELIQRFTYEHKGAKPNWDNIKIIHAWGNPKSEGIYYNFCKSHGVLYHDLNSATRLAGNSDDAFSVACKTALSEVKSFNKMYDVILIDEAQDFTSDFLRMCYEILPDEKRLIFAYDELQSLSKNSMDTPENIFGNNENGKPRVSLQNRAGQPKEDIILETCYRNSKPILVTAHALGFGIYSKVNNKSGCNLIQLFEEKSLWREVGYEVVDGELEDDQYVKLARTSKSSPEILQSHSSVEDIVHYELCEDDVEQAQWVADQIYKNLNEDELEFEDILVVHTDPYRTRTAVGIIREKLFEMGINSHLAGVSMSRDKFFMSDSITFTSIYRAKGNEAAMVYVVDSQNCYSGTELSRKRNILFTAITRSKAWVRISGYGKDAELLKEEFEEVKNNEFELSFVYPNKEQRRYINIVHRDKTKEDKLQISSAKTTLETLANQLENKELYIEDLPKELIDRVKEALRKNE